jgi:hypothetical protein
MLMAVSDDAVTKVDMVMNAAHFDGDVVMTRRSCAVALMRLTILVMMMLAPAEAGSDRDGRVGTALGGRPG